MSENPRLPFEAVPGLGAEWAKKWVEDSSRSQERLSLGGWSLAVSGEASPPFPTVLKRTVGNREFANQAEMEAWVREQGFAPDIEAQIVVPGFLILPAANTQFPASSMLTPAAGQAS
ncbi:MAG: hypothetical protein H7A53_06095 [Akkermansiaceae bacterium]|nr:hypothetical protein [Akkermansiaceae bacterium]